MSNSNLQILSNMMIDDLAHKEQRKYIPGDLFKELYPLDASVQCRKWTMTPQQIIESQQYVPCLRCGRQCMGTCETKANAEQRRANTDRINLGLNLRPSKDAEESLEVLHELAQKGDPEKQISLALRLSRTKGDTKFGNPRMWLERALKISQTKTIEALVEITHRYVSETVSTGTLWEKCFEWLLWVARYDVSRIESTINELRKTDEEKFRSFLLLFAQAGDAFAMHFYGTSLLPGKPSEAFPWLLKASYSNLAASQFEVGKMFLNGSGCVMNRIQGFFWLMVSSRLGHEKATKFLNERTTSLSPHEKSELEDKISGWLEK